MSLKNEIYKNILPPLKLLTKEESEKFFLNLKQLEFDIKKLKAA